MIRHGGPVVVFNRQGVVLGSFPDPENAEHWISWQTIRSSRGSQVRMWWVDTSDPLWRARGLVTRKLTVIQPIWRPPGPTPG